MGPSIAWEWRARLPVFFGIGHQGQRVIPGDVPDLNLPSDAARDVQS